MNPLRSVALAGRPNVGKSRLFNRLARRRIAIVHDQPGVTRDVNATEVDDGDGAYVLMDTGGIGLVADPELEDLVAAAEEQVFFAIRAAGAIFLLVDGREGVTPLDEIIAGELRKAGRPVRLVVNKVDAPEWEERVANQPDFAALGLGDPLLVSAEHGRGEDDLRAAIAEVLGPGAGADAGAGAETDKGEGKAAGRRVKICFAGRPNVGKSSLCNSLLQDERLVVSEVPGTTRDSVELDLDFRERYGGTWKFRLVDTAGLRRRRKMKSSVEYFSAVRSEEAIGRADAVLLVLDAREGVSTQDQNLAGKILEGGKPLAVVVNKWDYAIETFEREPIKGYETVAEFRDGFEKALRKQLFFLPDSPVVFASARTGYALERVLRAARLVDRNARSQLPTGRLNAVLEKALEARTPRLVSGRRFKVYYAVQTGVAPITVRLFCNQAAKLDETYRRYLERTLLREFELAGCPVKFEFVGKEKRYAKKGARRRG